MTFVSFLITYVAPVFIVVSPITSYTDQILAIHNTRSSLGFSLDIPLIMLLSSLLRCFYWFGARFSLALLAQSLIMIVMQLLLLRTALLHRPPPSSLSTPFAPALSSSLGGSSKRPFSFWQWRKPQPYFHTLLYLLLALACLTLLFPSSPTSPYTILLGYLALGIEATLPLPQLLANYRRKSCRGFRLSVIANWLLGDMMKMVFFFLADEKAGGVPWAFKACGVFQFICDLGLGAQYAVYGEGREEGWGEKGEKMERVGGRALA